MGLTLEPHRREERPATGRGVACCAAPLAARFSAVLFLALVLSVLFSCELLVGFQRRDGGDEDLPDATDVPDAADADPEADEGSPAEDARLDDGASEDRAEVPEARDDGVLEDAAPDDGTEPDDSPLMPVDYEVVRYSGTVVVDASLGEYVDADNLVVRPASGGNTALVRAVWTATDLLVSFSVSDAQLNAIVGSADGAVESDDAVTIFLDVAGNDGGSADRSSVFMLEDDFQFAVNIGNTRMEQQGSASGSRDIGWNGTWTSSVALSGSLNRNTDVDTSYTVEVGIPWVTIGASGAVATGFDFRMALAVNDLDASGAVSSALWPAAAIGHHYANAAGWTRVRLVER